MWGGAQAPPHVLSSGMPTDPLTQDLLDGVYSPPFVEPSLTYVWTIGASGGTADRQIIHAARIYADLVTPADYPPNVAALVEPTSLWEDVNTWWGAASPDGAGPLELLYDDVPPIGINYIPNAARQHFGGFGTPPQTLNPSDAEWAISPERFDARFEAMGQWAGYLTRVKIAMARATQFAYAPATEYFADRNAVLMAYNYLSSWQRVNHKAGDPSLKQLLEANPQLVAAAARMDQALSDYSGALGVSIPAGAKTIAGNRFPVSKAWWCGKLAAFGADAQGDPTQTLAVAQASKRFRAAAVQFRYAAGTVVTAWVQSNGGDETA